MQTNNIITQKERLHIAAQQLSGMQSSGYIQSDQQIRLNVEAALQSTDELIKQSGCIMEGAALQDPDLKPWSSSGFIHIENIDPNLRTP